MVCARECLRAPWFHAERERAGAAGCQGCARIMCLRTSSSEVERPVLACTRLRRLISMCWKSCSKHLRAQISCPGDTFDRVVAVRPILWSSAAPLPHHFASEVGGRAATILSPRLALLSSFWRSLPGGQRCRTPPRGGGSAGAQRALSIRVETRCFEPCALRIARSRSPEPQRHLKKGDSSCHSGCACLPRHAAPHAASAVLSRPGPACSPPPRRPSPPRRQSWAPGRT